jgi:hypothetical protein
MFDVVNAAIVLVLSYVISVFLKIGQKERLALTGNFFSLGFLKEHPCVEFDKSGKSIAFVELSMRVCFLE